MSAVRPVPPLIVLLGSPLLGGVVWERVAPLLRGRARDVAVPDVTSPTPHRVADVVATALGTLPADRPLAIVAHSNAGNLVPGIVAVREVDAVVLVDAAFPAEPGVHPVVPAHLVGRLVDLADERGMLPPWSSWFPDETIQTLGLDDAQLTRLRGVEPRIPLDYLTGTVEVTDDWARTTPGAYVSFGNDDGEGYAEERRLAASLGWRVRTVKGAHLHPLVAPEEVATVIDEELDALLGGDRVLRGE